MPDTQGEFDSLIIAEKAPMCLERLEKLLDSMVFNRLILRLLPQEVPTDSIHSTSMIYDVDSRIPP